MKVYFGIPWWPKNVLSSWWWRLHTGKGGTTKGISAAGCRIFQLGGVFCLQHVLLVRGSNQNTSDAAWNHYNWPSWLQYRFEGNTSFNMSAFLLKSLHKKYPKLTSHRKLQHFEIFKKHGMFEGDRTNLSKLSFNVTGVFGTCEPSKHTYHIITTYSSVFWRGNVTCRWCFRDTCELNGRKCRWRLGDDELPREMLRLFHKTMK